MILMIVYNLIMIYNLSVIFENYIVGSNNCSAAMELDVWMFDI